MKATLTLSALFLLSGMALADPPAVSTLPPRTMPVPETFKAAAVQVCGPNGCTTIAAPVSFTAGDCATGNCGTAAVGEAPVFRGRMREVIRSKPVRFFRGRLRGGCCG